MSILTATIFVCTPIAVWDGDGPIWCEEGPKIRISSIAAREIDGSCRPGHPCPRPSGEAARDALVELLVVQPGGGRLVTSRFPPPQCGADMRAEATIASWHPVLSPTAVTWVVPCLRRALFCLGTERHAQAGQSCLLICLQ